MGIRGELFSTSVQLDNRTYFFNVKRNRMGDLYLNIVESKNKEGGGFERASIVVFEDNAQAFLKGFDEALRVLEREAHDGSREKSTEKRVKRVVRARKSGDGERPDGEKKVRGKRVVRIKREGE
jgi:hypothetical protein